MTDTGGRDHVGRNFTGGIGGPVTDATQFTASSTKSSPDLRGAIEDDSDDDDSIDHVSGARDEERSDHVRALTGSNLRIIEVRAV